MPTTIRGTRGSDGVEPGIDLEQFLDHTAGGQLMTVESASTVSAKKRTPAIVTPRRPAGTVYRGREGMWSWVLHRITGVAIYFFLLVHILDTALVRLSPEAYNAVI